MTIQDQIMQLMTERVAKDMEAIVVDDRKKAVPPPVTNVKFNELVERTREALKVAGKATMKQTKAELHARLLATAEVLQRVSGAWSRDRIAFTRACEDGARERDALEVCYEDDRRASAAAYSRLCAQLQVLQETMVKMTHPPMTLPLTPAVFRDRVSADHAKSP